MRKRKIVLLFGDIFLLYASLFLALFLRNVSHFNLQFFFSHFLPFGCLYLFWLIFFYIFDLYEFSKKNLILRISSAVGFNFLFGVLIFYFVPFFKITPKTILILDSLFLIIFLFLWRKLFFSISFFENRITIIEQEKEIEKLKEDLKSSKFWGYKFVETKNKEDLLEKIKNRQIDTILFNKNFEKDPQFTDISFEAISSGINFLEVSKFLETVEEKISLSEISTIWFLENLKEGEKKIYDKAKRIFDLIFGFLILILNLPLWLLIIVAINLEDGGPIFYLQERVGKNKKIFKLIKFRSMIPHAEKEGPKWADIEDERTTKIGKILRRFHLDELPQMLNIISGDISLVGPRPERPEFVQKLEKEIPYYNLRHIIKPGFTGWAQIKFRYARSVMDSLEKFQYDLYYIKNRSFWLDLKIMLKTFQLFFKNE